MSSTASSASSKSEKIIARTRIETEGHLTDVIDLYREVFWRKDPDRAERIVRAMYAAGKIEQPRVDNGQVPVVLFDEARGRVWPWVTCESEIIWR